MSVKYIQSDGTVINAAGLTPGGNLEAGAVMTRTGTITIDCGAGTGNTATVIFDSPMPDANYLVDLTATAGGAFGVTTVISNKTVNGFDLTITRPFSSAVTITFTYTATKTYTVQHAAQNAEDIANILSVIPSDATSANKLATQSDLENIEIDVDDALDSSSENPVQNKVVKAAIDAKQDKVFIGTTAEWDALTTEQKNQYQLVNLTDDKEALGVDAADAVTDGDMRPITSNAVFDAFGANSLGKRYNPYREWVTDGSVDLNDVKTPGPYGNYLIRSGTPNGPGFYGYLVVFKWSNSPNVTQVVIGYNSNKIAMRYYISNTWSSWKIWE